MKKSVGPIILILKLRPNLNMQTQDRQRARAACAGVRFKRDCGCGGSVEAFFLCEISRDCVRGNLRSRAVMDPTPESAPEYDFILFFLIS